MKTLILGDTHIGCHNSDKQHHAYMAKFFSDMFAYIDENSIKTILQLGDLFDVRKYINTWSLNFFRTNFIEQVIKRDMQVIVLVGNHDIYFRESVAVSSVEEILSGYNKNFVFIKEPTEYILSDSSFLLIPWVCRENLSFVQESIKKTKAQYCAGHFEFDGFELFKGHPAKTGHSHQEYKKFDLVFSGHYHHGSHKDNVLYTGTPYELTWQDEGTTKGFYTLSSEGDLVFVENKHKIFKKVSSSSLDDMDVSALSDCNVRLIIDSPIDNKKREKLLEKIYSKSPIGVKIIETQEIVVDQKQDIQCDAGTPVSDMIVDYTEILELPANIENNHYKICCWKFIPRQKTYEICYSEKSFKFKNN